MDTSEKRDRYQGFSSWHSLLAHLKDELEVQADPKTLSETYIEVGKILENVFLEKGQAVIHYQKAYKVDPNNIESLALARNIYKEMGKPRMIAQLANLELNLIRNITGEDRVRASQLYIELGEALLDIGEVEKSKESFGRALSLDAQISSAQEYLEDIEDLNNWENRSRSLADRALEISNTDTKEAARLFLRAARILKIVDSTRPEIEEYLINSATLDVEMVSAINILENIYENEGQRDKIRNLHDNIILAAQSSSEKAKRTLSIGSRWAIRFEDRDTAVHYFKMAIEYEESVVPAVCMLSEYYYNKLDFEKIVEIAKNCVEDHGVTKNTVAVVEQCIAVLLRDSSSEKERYTLVGLLKEMSADSLLLEEVEKKFSVDLVKGEEPFYGDTENATEEEETREVETTVELADDDRIIEEVSTIELEEVYRENENSEDVVEPNKTSTSYLSEDVEDVLLGAMDNAEEETELSTNPDSEMNGREPVSGDMPDTNEKQKTNLGTVEEMEELGAEEKNVADDDYGKQPTEDEELSSEVLEAIEEAKEAESQTPTRAIEGWRKVLRLDPENILAIDNLTRLFEQLKRWPDLVKMMKAKADVVNDIERKIEINLQVAELFLERFSNQSEAIKAYEKVKELDPKNKMALENLREMYERRRDWENLLGVMQIEAEDIEDHAEKLNKYLEIAELATERVKKPSVCIDLWENVLRLDPTSVTALSSLAMFYERNKDFDKLADVLSAKIDLIDDEKEKTQSLIKLGTITGDKLKDSRRAVAAWESLLEIKPDDRRAQEQLKKHLISLQAWEELEAFYKRNEKWDELIRVLEREAEKPELEDETSVKLLFKLAELWKEHKQRVDRTANAFEKILQIDGQNLEAAEALIPIYEENNDAENLVRVCEVKLNHIEEEQEKLEMQRRIAVLCETKLDDVNRAFGWFAESLRTEPSYNETWNDLERVAGLSGRWNEVVEIFREVYQNVNKPVEFTLRLARILDEELGQAEESLEYYHSVLEVEPTNEKAILGLIKLYGQLGLFSKLLELCDHQYELSDDENERKEILFKKAAILEDQLQNLDAAITSYRSILDLDETDEKALLSLDRLYESQGEWETLAEIIERRIELGAKLADEIELKDRLGEIKFKRLGDDTGAVKYYKEILESVPDHEHAINSLEYILEKNVDLQPEIAEILDPVYQNNSDWEKLIKVLEILLKNTENTSTKVRLLLRIGSVYYEELGLLENSFNAYARTIYVSPTSHEAREKIFEIATALGCWKELAELLIWAATQVEDKEMARNFWISIAEIQWEELEEAEEAINSYQKVLQIEPNDLASLKALENIFTHVENWQELIVVLRKKNELTFEIDEKINLLNQMARIYDEMLDEKEEAASCYREILAFDTNNIEALQSLDRLYFRQEQWSELADNIHQQLSLTENEDERIELQLRLASLREKQMDELETAIEIYRDIITGSPNNEEAKKSLERLIDDKQHRLVVAEILEPIYEDSGEWEKLIEVINILIENSEDMLKKVELKHRIAELYEIQGDDLENALKCYSEALDFDPTDQNTISNLERLADVLDLYPTLARIYEHQAESLRETPDLAADFHAKVAVLCEEKLDDIERSITHWKKVLDLDPINTIATDALIRIYQFVENYKKLAETLIYKSDIVDDIENKKSFLFKAGEISEAILEDSEGAISVYTRILDLDVDDFEALGKLEALYLRLEKWEELQTVYQRKTDLVDTVEDKKQILYVMGAVYEREVGDLAKAIDTYQRILELDPDDLESYQRLDKLFQTTGQWQELRDVLEREAELVVDPDEVIGFKYRIGEIWEKHLDDISRAVDVYSEILEVVPDHPETISSLEKILQGEKEPLLAADLLERIYNEAGEWQKLINVLEVRIRQISFEDVWERIQLYHRIAEIYESDLHLESPEKAFDMYTRAIKEDASNIETINALERLAEITGKWSELSEIYDSLFQKAEDVEEIIDIGLRLSAILEERLVKPEEAIIRLVRILEYEPENRTALSALDRLYQMTENWNELVEILRRESMLASSPEDALDFQFRLGQVYQIELENEKEAVECYREILAAAPEHVNTLLSLEQLFAEGVLRKEIHEILDPLYRMSEQWDKLVSINESLLEQIGDEFERLAHFHKIAELYEEKLFDSVSAFNWYGRAVREFPENEQSIENFERLAQDTSGWEDAIQVYDKTYDFVSDKEIRKTIGIRIARVYENNMLDIENAEEMYRKVLDIDPSETIALESLDRIYLNELEWDKLAGIIERRIDEADTVDEKIEFCFRLGKIHEEQREDDESAERCLRRIVEEYDEHHIDALNSLEEIYFRSCSWENLYSVFEKKVDYAISDAARAELYSKMAITAAEAMGKIDTGISLWISVLDILGEDTLALDSLGNLYLQKEDWKELVDVLERKSHIEESDEARVTLYEKLGEVWGSKLNDDRNALDNWERVLDIDPRNIKALRSLASIHDRNEDWHALVDTILRQIEFASMDMDEAELRECYAKLGTLYSEKLEQPFDAIESWLKVLQIESDDIEAIQSLEKLYIKEERWEDCIGVLDHKADLANVNSEKIGILMKIASIWEDNLCEPMNAESAYERIIEIDPMNLHAFAKLEEIYNEEMSWEKLINLFIVRLGQTEVSQTERFELYGKIAGIYENKLDSPENAFLVLQNAFEEDYTNENIAEELERLASRTNKWGDLVAKCNEAFQTAQQQQNKKVQISLAVKLGKWYAEIGKLEWAISSFGAALQIDTENTQALKGMAEIYKSSEQWDSLAQVLTRIVEVSTDSEEKVETLCFLGEIYEQKLGKLDLAMTTYKASLDIYPGMVEALNALQRLYKDTQNWKELIKILQQKIVATEDIEEIVDLQQKIGEIYEHNLDEINQAINAYKEVLNHDQNYLPALKGLEGLYTREERWQDLLDILELQLDVITTERERISLLLRMATMLEEEFVKPERAAEKLESVLDIDPNNEKALVALERIYRHARRWQDLVDTLFRHIEAVTDRETRIELYHRVADVYAEELDDPHSAIEALRNVLSIVPKNILALEKLSELFQKIEDWSGANDALSRLTQIVPEPEKRVELSYRLGYLLSEHIGDYKGSIEQYQAALDIDPGHLQSLASLRKIYIEDQDWVAAARILQQEQEYTQNERQRSLLLYKLGEIYQDKLELHEQAIECFELSISYDSENVEAAQYLIEEYVKEEKWETVEPLLDLVIRKSASFKPEPSQLQRYHFLLGEASANLGKDDKAIKAYRTAYEIDATHLATLRSIAALYFKNKDWEKSFKFYQMILVHHREAQTDEEIVEIFYRLGIIKLEMDERRKALNMFDKSLEINSHHKPTLRAVIGMHEKHGDWEKVIHYKKTLMETATADEKFEILVQIGDIWQEKIKNSQKAIQSYNDALEMQEENRQLLHKLLNLYTATEQWLQAVEIIEKIAELEQSEQRVAKYHYSMALVFRDKIKDPQNAIEHFNRALDKDPEQLKAFEAIDRILTMQKDWKNLERNYRKMLHRITGKGKEDIEVNLWHFLGEIYRSRMGNFSAAAEAFRMASGLDPNNLDRHKILAELYMMIPDQWESAVEEHQYLIRKNPYRVDSYKALRKIYFDTRQYDKAWCLCATLSFLKKADSEEQSFFEQYKTKGIIRAQARLDNERWIKDLFHPEEDLYIGKIFETILSAVRKFKIQPQKAFGLRKKDKHDPNNSTIAFAKTFSYVAQVISLPFMPELYLRPDQAMGLQYAITEPPASVVGQLLLSGFTPQDLTFEIGRHLAYYRGEHYIRWVEPTTSGLRILLLSAIKTVNPQFKTPPDPSGVLDHTVNILSNSLTPTAKEQLSALVKKFIQQRGEVDIKKWVNSVEITACRCGFLLCNDIQSAARMIQNQSSTVGDIPAKDKIKELVLFSVSEQYFKLRQALGVTIGQ